MAKVISVQHLVLRPGVQPAAFEEFLVRAVSGVAPWPGMKSYVAKGDRGDLVGQYALIFEFDDVATRNRYFPQPDVLGPEAQQHLEKWLPFVSEWQQYATWAGSPSVFTDYMVLGEF